MRYIITLLVGLVIGAAAAVFLLGVPRAKTLPGSRVGPPPGTPAAQTVVVSLPDEFLDGLLTTVFKDLGPPTFNISSDLSGADRKSTRLNSSHSQISYAVFCLKKKKKEQ